jgi:hypothetical protein
MIAGLPGTGIGGLFYLLASGWMFARECWSGMTNRASRIPSALAKRQVLLGLSMVTGMWATGEMFGRILLQIPANSRLGRALDVHSHNVWHLSILYWTLATLGILYGLMQMLRVIACSPVERGRKVESPQEVFTLPKHR